MTGWPSEVAQQPAPEPRYFYNNESGEFFLSYQDEKAGGKIIELPKDLWEQRKRAAAQINLDTLKAKMILAEKRLKQAKEARDQAKAAFYECFFGDEDLSIGTHTEVLEVVDPQTGEVQKLQAKATIGRTISLDQEALDLLRPSIPAKDWAKIFESIWKMDNKEYDALPETSKKFLASAVTIKEKAPTFSFEVLKE